jgi:RNA polymerase sigma-70 factor (ECF subfamily)
MKGFIGIARPNQGWDRALIEEGRAIVRACARRDQPGAYQLQAAINAVHAEELSMDPARDPVRPAACDLANPVVAMNRAIAIGQLLRLSCNEG